MFLSLINPNDPVFVFSILLFIILIFPPLFSKIKLPSIIGLIIAGVIIGPNSLGIVEKNAAIDLLSKIGILYIMFLAGLEVDLFQVKKKIQNTLIFGLITFVIPLAMGTIVALFILKMSLVSSILLASMFSSHTLLTYPIVSKLGLLKRSSVTSTIGGTIITDVLALFILAVIASSANDTEGYIFWLKFAGFLTIYLFAIIFIIPNIGKLFFKSHPKDDVIEYVFVLFMVLFCSYLAHLAGLEPIIGAFLAGFIFNSLIPQKSVLMNRIDFIGNSIFIPIFLISVGMLVDVKMLFSDSKTWIVSGCMITVALISKLAAALITKRILKWGKYEAGLSYGLSVNQAAATLASVLVGYSLKFFDDSILTGTIMMITVTCFVGPIITDFFAKKIVLSQENGNSDLVKTNLRIMTPINNRNNVKELMELAFILHKKYSTDAIYPTNIVMDSFEVERELLNAEKIVSHAVAESVAVNVNVTPVTRVDLNISSGILKAARDLRITCIITGWNGNKSSIGKIFGYTIDPIIEGSTQIMIVNKIVRSFRTCERIILLIPPLVEKQTGFQELFEIIKNISEQLQTAITIVANEDTVRNAQNAIQKTKMTLLTGIIRLKNWKDITQTLDNIIKETDLVALFSARITRPAWQPILNKLPGIISKKYPKNNITTLFPAEEKWLDNFEDKKKNKDDLYKILKKENIFFNLEKFKIQEAMKHMLSKKFGSQHETLSFLTSTLTNIFHNEPVQLLDDVVLVHAHISHIEDYVVYIGVNKNGFEIQNLSSKVKILIILLNSTENNAEYHLNLLKEIVSMVKNDIFVNSLKDATSLKDFEKRIKS